MTTLESLAEAIVDCEHKTAPRGDGFAISVGTKAMKDGRLDVAACKPVSAATYDTWTRRMRLAPGDLILAREAPVGQVVRVPDWPRICLGQRTVAIRPDAHAVDPRFLHYWLLGPDAQHAMASRAAGATVPHLNVADIRALDVSAMPIDRAVQHAAGALLGAIDDLIESNRRRVEVLEDMARAIYREWFVHLRYPGHENDALVDSGLGPIPVGWNATVLGSVADVNRRSRTPAEDEVIQYLDISSLGDRVLHQLAEVVGALAPGRARREVRGGDTVWSMVRPNRRAHALLVEPGTDWIASTGLAVLSPRDVSPAFLFEAVSTTKFSDHLVSQESGSAYPAVRPRDFENAPVLVPTPGSDALFDETVAPLHRLIWMLREGSERAAGLRDLLLPKLVTGQIDVSKLDLDALFEAATT